MAEKLVFTAAVVDPVRTGVTASVPDVLPYRIALELGINRGDGSAIPTYVNAGSLVQLSVAGAKGFDLTVNLATDATAKTQITALNKANLTSNTLLKRALTELAAFLSAYTGTISGSPD